MSSFASLKGPSKRTSIPQPEGIPAATGTTQYIEGSWSWIDRQEETGSAAGVGKWPMGVFTTNGRFIPLRVRAGTTDINGREVIETESCASVTRPILKPNILGTP